MSGSRSGHGSGPACDEPRGPKRAVCDGPQGPKRARSAMNYRARSGPRGSPQRIAPPRRGRPADAEGARASPSARERSPLARETAGVRVRSASVRTSSKPRQRCPPRLRTKPDARDGRMRRRNDLPGPPWRRTRCKGFAVGVEPTTSGSVVQCSASELRVVVPSAALSMPFAGRAARNPVGGCAARRRRACGRSFVFLSSWSSPRTVPARGTRFLHRNHRGPESARPRGPGRPSRDVRSPRARAPSPQRHRAAAFVREGLSWHGSE